MGYCKLLGGGITIGKYVWKKTKKKYNYDTQTLSVDLFEDRQVTSSGKSIRVYIADDYTIDDDGKILLVNPTQVGGTDTWWSQNPTVLNGKYMVKDRSYFVGNGTSGDVLYKVILQASMVYKPPYCLKGSTCEVSTITPIITPKGFVIANKQSAHPENGFAGDGNYQTGGDWYELIAQLDSTNVMSLSNNAYEAAANACVDEIRKAVAND